MFILEELKDIRHYLKKSIPYILLLYILIEGFVFYKIGRTNRLMFLGSLFITLFVLTTLVLMFKDFKTSLLIFTLSIPLLPMVLYIFLRMNVLNYGEFIYFIYFVVLLFSIRKGKFDFSRLSLRGKYKKQVILYAYFIISVLISAFISDFKFEALELSFLGLIMMLIISVLMLSMRDCDSEFIRKIILFLSIGVGLSGIPDTFVALFNLVVIKSNVHLYGAMGSNFMLGYTLMVLPYILFFAVNKEVCPKNRKIYQLLLLIETVNICTQRSRGTIVGVIICFMLIIFMDKKNIKKYLGIFIVMASFLTYNILQRWEFSEFLGNINTKGIKKAIFTNKGFFAKLAKQTKSRRPVWSIAFNMMDDFPWFGVGPGHFKYYFPLYAPELNRVYIDAHNIFLDLTTELGIPFAVVFFISWWVTIIKSIKNVVKSNKIYFKEFIWPGFTGMLSLLVYGLITGQAFITSRAPISIVPAFIFTILITVFLIIGEKNGVKNL